MIDKDAWVDYSAQRDALRAEYRPTFDRFSASTPEQREAAWQELMVKLDALRERFEITAEVNERVITYEYSVFTEADDPEHYIGLSSWTIEVAYRGRGLWGVLHRGFALGKDGTWDYESSPSNREDDWLGEHRWPLAEAQERALKAAPHVSVNGRTAAEVKIELLMEGKIK
jgi:hypothetical protein